MTYSKKLIALVVALNLAVMGAAGWMLVQSRSNHFETAKAAVENLSELLVHDIGASFASTDEVLQELIVEHSLELDRGKPDNLSVFRHIGRQLARHPELLAISMIGPDGAVRGSVQGAANQDIRTFSDSVVFKEHLRIDHDDLLVSEPQVGQISGREVISFSRRLVNNQGHFDGIVVAEFGLQTLVSRFAKLQIGQRGSIALRDSQLRLIVRHPGFSLLPGEKSPALSDDFRAALMLNAMAGTYTSGTTSIDGVRRIHSYQKHPKYPVYINVGISTEDAYADWVNELWFALSGGLVLALSTGFGARTLIRKKRHELAASTALASSKARLIRAELGSKSGNWELHLATQSIVPSVGAAQIYGLSPNQFRLSAVQAMVLPEYRSLLDTALHRLLENDEPYEVEFKIKVAHTGEVKDIYSKAELDRSRGIVFGLIQDITQRKAAQKALQESEEHLRLLANHAKDVIWTIDSKGFVTYISPSVTHLRGFTPEELVGRHIRQEVSEPARTYVMDIFDRSVKALSRSETGKPFEAELEYRCKDGSTVWVETTATPMRNAAGEFVGFVGVSRDITEKRKDRERLRLASRVIDHAREGIIITNAQGDMIEVNHAFERITGYRREEAKGKNPRILKSGRQTAGFYETLWNDLRRKGYWSGEVWNRRKNGEVYAALQTIIALADTNGAVTQYVALFSDITPMKEHQQQLEHLAQFDPLTDLPNRVLLADRLQQAIAQAARHRLFLAVAYLDLDGFKQIKDEKGHDVGDAFLVALSRRMSAALREADTFARVGGDEFVAVLVDLPNPKDSDQVLTRLLQAASSEIIVEGESLRVSASIGVTIYPDDAVVADQLVRHADQAMYQAKQSGKNRYHLFDVKQEAAIKNLRESISSIQLAMDRNEFVLYYQPKVNMRTGEVIGMEALIRWQHPERGLLPPSAFLPVVENDPMGIQLGDWVIETALHQLAQWTSQGLSLPVSINLSAQELQQHNFVNRLADQLAQHPLTSPNLLELEILETSALRDLSEISTVISACQALGVGFALDDFGTGYSSLTYLKHLPVAMLKIDQSFVRDMLEDPEDRAIVDGVIRLSKAFHLNVIAEGVETVEHGLMLLNLGCDLAQGYGIARPMPADHVPDWVTSWKTNSQWLEARLSLLKPAIQ